MERVLLFVGLGAGVVLFLLALTYSDLLKKLTVHPKTLWPLGGLDVRADYVDADFTPLRSLKAKGGGLAIVTLLLSSDQRTAAIATGRRQVLISNFNGKIMTTVSDGEYPPLNGELRQKFKTDRFADFYEQHTYAVDAVQNHGIGVRRFDAATAPDYLTTLANGILRPSPRRYLVHILNPMGLRSSTITPKRIEQWRNVEIADHA